ncbi:MAG: TolC family protein [Acidobacteriota bacterium]|nr:TolC family protein [Acidobacteriota bacterium]
MKRFPKFQAARAVALVLGVWCAFPALGQDQPVVSSHPGNRRLVPLPAANAQGVSLSLSQAVGIAVANNQDQYVTVNAAESFEYLIVQNKGIYDPLISAAVGRSHAEIPGASRLTSGIFDDTTFSASVSQFTPLGGTFALGFNGTREKSNNQFVTVNPSYAGGLQLSMNQPLLRNFGTLPSNWLIRIAHNSRDSAYQSLLRTVQGTVNAVEQAYWDLVYATQNLEVKRESLRIARELNRITRIKIDVGSLAPIDITQTEVGIATAEQDIIISEGQIGDAQDRLKRLLNFVEAAQVNIPIIPTDRLSTEQVKIQLDEGTQTALRRRPEVLQIAYTAATDLLRYQYYRNQTLPALNLTGSYGSRGLAGLSVDPVTGRVTDTNFSQTFRDVLDRNSRSWAIGLNFSYPILNRGARGAAGVARYTWEADRAQMSVVEQNVIVEVRTAARAIDTAQRSIVAATKGRELAERNLDAEKKKFDNGMSTTFQVNQIQRDLSAARTAEQQALAIYRKALAQYHFAISDNLDWKGIRVEGLPESEPPVVNIEGGMPAPAPIVR